ncbi:MAG: type II toxin-antitoxin system Phd/YefM family antitoxin [Treponema sp.]|jgi:antitoxin (DNA-binding transcriptional repressor) of toxin-antitoxin stability system|nr:type II toxin-antitoxin system Phd/YefM family antitoxin [Treponema sp.]
MNITVDSAKNYFMEMIDEVANGKEYFIIRHGQAIARIVPVFDDVPTRAEITERLFSYQTLT